MIVELLWDSLLLDVSLDVKLKKVLDSENCSELSELLDERG